MSPRDILSRVASIDWEGSKVSVLLASLPHSAELPTVHALNMTSPLASEFRRIARDVTQALDTSQRAGDLVLSPFDAGFKPDSHEVEWLQIAELDALSQTLDCIPKNVANATIFAPDDTFLSF